MSSSATIVVAGGKTLLRAALLATTESDRGRILFLTDCDYDVRRGELLGGPDVVITHGCDVESDLIELGVLNRLAVELTPRAIETGASAARIGSDVRDHARMISVALGKVRMAGQALGVDLCLDKLDLSKVWDKDSDIVLSDKIEYITWARLKQLGVSKAEWHTLLENAPKDILMCNGKDLVRAVQLFFRKLYGMNNNVTPEIIAMMLRLATSDDQFESWSVVARIHKWESRHERRLLCLRR
jgi:hypothetical protein